MEIRSNNKVTSTIDINDCWQFKTQVECRAATGENGIIVSHGKHGLAERVKEGKKTFILFPKGV